VTAIRKNDIVQVITGKGKGHTGKVLQVDRDSDRILVEGANFVWKHIRRNQEYRHGARIKKEAPLHVSNVRLICQACQKPTRVQRKRLEDGSRVRICRECRQAVTPEE